MKKLFFTKMQGIGNDYIYFDCFKQEIENPNELAVKLSDRHFGIGGDGIVLICPSNVADAKMRMFNLDGSEGKMCGNAIRCVGKYLYDNAMVDKKEISIETLSGIKYLTLYEGEDGKIAKVKVDMGQAELEAEKIPVTLKKGKIISEKAMIGNKEEVITCVSMGNPHCVVFVDSVVLGRNKLKMRVWERGSGETLACGTGACAGAVAAVLSGYADMGKDITVSLIGGELTINYTSESVMMTGAAAVVFNGEVEI